MYFHTDAIKKNTKYFPEAVEIYQTYNPPFRHKKE